MFLRGKARWHPVPSGRPQNENMDQDESTLVLEGNRLSHSITLKTDFVAPWAVGQSFYEERYIIYAEILSLFSKNTFIVRQLIWFLLLVF